MENTKSINKKFWIPQIIGWGVWLAVVTKLLVEYLA